MTLPSRSRTAAAAFDALGARYEDIYVDVAEHHAALDWLLDRLPPSASVLDIGSGTGRPTAQRLADAGHDVLGIDVSEVMVELARTRVPGARFELADVRDFTPTTELHAVTAFFAMLQMTRDEQRDTVHRAARWLAPGGHLVLATVPADVQDVPIEFLGQPVRATSFGPEAVVELLGDAGLVVEHSEQSLFTPTEPGLPPEPQLFCFARRPLD